MVFQNNCVPDQGDSIDDTAMNGIKFECSQSSEEVSYYGYFGEWDDRWQYCSGGFSGADIKIDSETVSFFYLPLQGIQSFR